MEVDEVLLKEIENKVLPYIKKTENEHAEKFNEELTENFLPKFDVALKMQFNYSYFLEKTFKASDQFQDDNFLLKRDKAQLILFEHLMLAEGLFDRMLGLLCLFGIWDNNDFEIRKGSNMVKIEKVEDIMRTFTHQKINFLINCNDDFEMFREYRFRDLRNAIAHCDYRIIHDGNVIFTSEELLSVEMNYLDIQEINVKIKDVCMAFNETMKKHYKKYSIIS